MRDRGKSLQQRRERMMGCVSEHWMVGVSEEEVCCDDGRQIRPSFPR